MSSNLFGPHLWFTAEGLESGKPALYRGRTIPVEFVGDSELPRILVATVRFDITDSIGLPSAAQYDILGQFESACIDSIEERRLGLTVFIKTSDGVVQYFLYVSDVDAVVDIFTDRCTPQLKPEFDAGDDPDWTEYRSFLKGVQFGKATGNAD